MPPHPFGHAGRYRPHARVLEAGAELPEPITCVGAGPLAARPLHGRDLPADRSRRLRPCPPEQGQGPRPHGPLVGQGKRPCRSRWTAMALRLDKIDCHDLRDVTSSRCQRVCLSCSKSQRRPAHLLHTLASKPRPGQHARMKVRALLDALLQILVIVGLVLGPLAAKANGSAMAAASLAASMDMSTMADNMPCCPPEKLLASDCWKICPLVAGCIAKNVPNPSVLSVAEPVLGPTAAIGRPDSDALGNPPGMKPLTPPPRT